MIAVIIDMFQKRSVQPCLKVAHWLDGWSVEVGVLKNEKGTSMYNGGLVALQLRFHSLVSQ